MKKYTFLPIIYGLLVVASCRPEPPEPDPCAGKNPVTADFHMYEQLNLAYPDGWELYDTDTVATGSVIFKALEEDAQYEWRLGRETIRERTFARSGFPRGVTIPVSLKVTKTPDNDCFPEDSGVVTKTREFYTTIWCHFPALKGRFEGYRSDNLNELVTVEIDPCYPDPEDRLKTIYPRIINLEPDCDIYRFRWLPAYKQLYFASRLTDLICKHPVGIMRVHGAGNDSITIKYSIAKYPLGENTERLFKTFKGRRIH